MLSNRLFKPSYSTKFVRFYSASTRSGSSNSELSDLTQSVKSLNTTARRALFYVPGSDERKINSSFKLTADCLVYDLEDSVSFNRKGAARKMVFEALANPLNPTSEKAVRVNSLESGLQLDDLEVVLRSDHLQAVVLPKVHSQEEIRFVSHIIDQVAPESVKKNIKIIASIESAKAIMNLKEIASCDPRLDALIFAAEDFCADLGLVRTSSRKELLYARSAVVTAAKAYGIQAIDLVCLDYKNEEILEEECVEGFQMGFTGKQAIHPKQIDLIQKFFSPSEAEIERARKIVEGYIQHSQSGIGAFSLDGKVIDLPVVKWAERILARLPKELKN